MKYKFGNKLRLIREKKKITLKEVAKKIDLSESLISQIERNKVSPAIDTLLDIAGVLDVDLEYLFSEFKINKNVNLIKRNERKQINSNNVLYQQLSKTIEEDEHKHGMEAYYMEIAPGAESGSTEYGHPGKELGVIIEGEGEFTIGTEKYILQNGDSISFNSDVPHLLKNTGTLTLKAYWIITPPKMFFKDM